MSLFQEVDLSGCPTSGRLFLHSMPGRFESISTFVVAMGKEEISRVLCLVSDAEIQKKSPTYLDALAIEKFKRRVIRCPVEDFNRPENMEAFRESIAVLVETLTKGRNALIHCAAGVGRTGMAAVCLLTDLGLSIEEASRRVRDADAGAETEPQQAFIRDYCQKRKSV